MEAHTAPNYRVITGMKIALYNPGWHVMGGGETYFATIAEILSADHWVDLIIARPVDFSQLEDRASVSLSSVGRIELTGEALSEPRTPFQWVRNRVRVQRLRRELQRVTSRYDLAFLLESDQPFALSARRSILHIQIPHRRWSLGEFLRAVSEGRHREARRALARELMFRQALRSFDFILYNSHFTAQVVEGNWSPGVPSAVLHPPIEVPATSPRWEEKSSLILSVGRFFVGGHEKRHAVLIHAFRRFCERASGHWELHLVGGAERDPATKRIIAELKEIASGLPVVFHINAPRAEVIRLYRAAKMFWHASGLGVDEARDPDRVEHFGMAVAEAMAYGVIPLVVSRGGLREIVQHGVSGYVWETVEQLLEQAHHLAHNETAAALSRAAFERSHQFSRARFAEKLHEIVRSVMV